MATPTRSFDRIFDRSTKGRSTEPVDVHLERGRIRFFSQILSERDPIHFDVGEARARGYPDIVAPASFFVVLEADANEELRRKGLPSAAALVRCDYERLLHGEESYTYSGLLFAGDRVTLRSTVVDFYEKRGGELEFAVIEATASHAERGPIVQSKRSLIHRLG